MPLIAPVILLPTNGVNYATDTATQTLSGTTSTDTKDILVNNSTFGVSYTPGTNVWSWTGTLIVGINAVSIVAIERVTEQPSPVTTIQITLVQSNSFITVSAPTGVRLRAYQDKIEVVNAKNPETQTVGYNYYVSLESGGGSSRSYAKINTNIVNDFTFFEESTTLLSQDISSSGNIKVTTTTEEVVDNYFYSVFFDKTVLANLISAGQLPTVSMSEDQPFFFVITAVIYDPSSGQVTESAYSIELQGSPITITTGVRTLPGRSQNNIVLTFSQELLTGNKSISTLPGTVVRDIIDPISEEMARVYVIQDFLARALSVSALQDFDDASGSGSSDPVSTSIQKQALKISLNLTRDADVQGIIDAQFDLLASNVDVIRRGFTAATGFATFYTLTAPIRDMTVNIGASISTQGNLDQGIPSQNYITLETKTITLANRDQFFNPLTGRYEVSVQIQALTAGAAGNTDAFTITSVSSGADASFQVENPNPVSYGQDRESNHDIATRIELAMYADTGTLGGYKKTVANVQGVRRLHVEAAGDPLMIRDYDDVRKEHIGGKVDVYIQGERIKQVADQIAFSFQSIGNAQGTQAGETFVTINVAAFEFKSINPRVGAHTPIFEVSRVYNATRLREYDITNFIVIGDGDTIKLNETLPTNVGIGLAAVDVIQVDYKFRSSDTYILKNQPVLNIVSVAGQISGPLTTDNYEIVSLEDPLAEGLSTIAIDSIRIKYANGLPLNAFQTITDESHIIILDKNEPLNFIGADPESIIVRSLDNTITYIRNVDYRIITGTDTTSTAILMLETGGLSNGQEVLISYTAIENFTVTYTTNDLLNSVQYSLDNMKHACADAIAKQAVRNSVDLTFTVVPKTTASTITTGQNTVDTTLLTSKITTAIGNYVNQLGLGESLTQSDVVHLIRSVPEVAYVVLPMNRMVKSDGSLIIRDSIGRTEFEILNDGLARAYITVAPVLTYGTVDQGGPANLFRGVFEDSEPLVLQTHPLDVSGGAGRAYIRADGRIIVSPKDGQLPDNKSYDVSYYVFGETGSKDINVASLEYLTIGTPIIKYDV